MSEAVNPALGRFDVHSHLLPGIDDGCANVEESIRCARELVRAGYSRSFCTPHIWPSLRHNTADSIPKRVAELQKFLDAAAVPLKLFPGGEMNLRPDFIDAHPSELLTYNLNHKFALFDLWADALPPWFEPTVKWMQHLGLKTILAHPERMRAVQLDPDLVDYFEEIDLLLQGNLQCLGDPPRAATRQIAERYLTENRYFLLGMDLHNYGSLPVRLTGLQRAIEMVGNQAVDQLTIHNPATLLV